MAILVSWFLCFIFTVTDVFPPEKDKYGFYARTDARQGILTVAPWFKIPYPCTYVDEKNVAVGILPFLNLPRLHIPALIKNKITDPGIICS